MEISKINSLVELFFNKLEEVDNTKSFLNSLKSEKLTYSWKDVSDHIFKLSSKLKTLIKPGDRCLILSENNPNWFIADISIMNAGGISVPIFTTYSDNDYKYILEDCKPTLVIVSNTAMATLLDIGEKDDIHPANKQDMGKRLALLALDNNYNFF